MLAHPPGSPVGRSLPNFAHGMVSRIHFLTFEFWKDRSENAGAVWVEISLLPLKRHIAYTTAYCYRTSHAALTHDEYNDGRLFFGSFSVLAAKEYCGFSAEKSDTTPIPPNFWGVPLD